MTPTRATTVKLLGDAVQFYTDSHLEAQRIADWCGGILHFVKRPHPHWHISFNGGEAWQGDWIIQISSETFIAISDLAFSLLMEPC